LNTLDEKTILVADDEKFIRDILRLHLEKVGYNVILSNNGEEAIEALKNRDISVALTDIKMPKVDGFGVLDYVKKHCEHIPVIMLTGYVDVETAVRAMKKGSLDYITKPIKKSELLDAIKYALSRRNSTYESRPFEISEIYLLKDNGIVIYHDDLKRSNINDSDIFGSMFTAIKIFIRDSFNQSDEELKTIEHGRFKILIEEGDDFFLVVIGTGGSISDARDRMRQIINNINKRYGATLKKWNGNMCISSQLIEEFNALKKVGQ
jgi:DNA-binding response OmpR family regulator